MDQLPNKHHCMNSGKCLLHVDICFELFSPPANQLIHQAVLELGPLGMSSLSDGIRVHEMATHTHAPWLPPSCTPDNF